MHRKIMVTFALQRPEDLLKYLQKAQVISVEGGPFTDPWLPLGVHKRFQGKDNQLLITVACPRDFAEEPWRADFVTYLESELVKTASWKGELVGDQNELLSKA